VISKENMRIGVGRSVSNDTHGAGAHIFLAPVL
jgi:hypothetical protein